MGEGQGEGELGGRAAQLSRHSCESRNPEGRENAPSIIKSNDSAAVKGTAHCANTPRYADSIPPDS